MPKIVGKYKVMPEIEEDSDIADEEQDFYQQHQPMQGTSGYFRGNNYIF